MLEPTFWDDNEHAQQVTQQLNHEKERLAQIEGLIDQYSEVECGLELYRETQDQELYQEVETMIHTLSQQVERFETARLLSGEYDSNDAILEIHPGAGGTESQDWGEMLLRMYTRYCHSHNLTVNVIDYQGGDEAGLKSVTLEVKGYNAYGLLKSEKGVHRLIRISPFDSNSRRHTSFASVEVTPIIEHSIELEIMPDDLRIDTYRASGAGGQHINKTDSAVRITHLPTGIVTQSQSERSQIQNREQALSLLKAKLYQRQLDEQAEQLAEIKGEQKDNAWGSQIRSYVFHPYSMVKDHRTSYEIGNTDKVMDGEIDDFVEAYLKWSVE